MKRCPPCPNFLKEAGLALAVSIALASCAPSPLKNATSPADIDIRQLLLNEVGVTARASEAASMLGQAAASGDTRAQIRLGAYSYLGIGVPENHARAAALFRAAADHGDPHGQFLAAVLSARGDGSPKDLVESYKLLTRAAEAGDHNARDAERLRTLVEREMSPAELRRAQSNLD